MVWLREALWLLDGDRVPRAKRPPVLANGAVCEHAFVSLGQLHFAIRERRIEDALAIYDELRFVPARYLCRLALLLAESDHQRYEEVARDLLVAVAREREPKLIQLMKLADALAHVHDYIWWWEAQEALRRCVGQLHRNWRALNVEFDSLNR